MATVLKRRRRRVMAVSLKVLERQDDTDDWELLAATDEEVDRTEEDNE